MIKNFVKAAVLCAAFSGGVADASTIDFSYTFADGLSLNGSLTGTLDGMFIDDISNIAINFNGTPFVGPLFAGTFNAATSSYDYSPGAAVMSTNPSLNNFVFADSNDPQGNGVTNFYYFVNGTTPSGSGTQEVFAVNTNTGDIDLANPALGNPSGTSSLTPVPLPAALPLFASGLGLLAAMRRRRRGLVQA